MISIPQRYRLIPGPTRVTLTLLPQSGAYFTLGGNPNPVQSFSSGEAGRSDNSPTWFSVYSPGGQVAARAEVAYATVRTQPEWRSPASCHLYFRPGSLDWIWNGAAIAGDNASVLCDGEGPHSNSAVAFQAPVQPNSAKAPQQFPCLDANRVSLLDRSSAGNMIFRGNAPLSPTPGNQLVDFDALHATLKLAYFNLTGQSDFPEKGRYVLRNIALLDSRAEAKMLMRELMSFGGTDLKNRSWFPAEAAGVSRSGILGQMMHWPVSPSDTLSDSTLELTKIAASQLRTWMSRRETLPHIYYIHCADGQERTSVMSAWYLLTNREMSVSDAYMLGSSVNGLPVGL
jgi:hypothetical protein